MMEDFKTLATNPQQYDSPELNWEIETEDSPLRKYFSQYLEQYLGDLSNKKVLDIGSGTGYLSKLYSKLGATDIFGVEPSEDNVRVSQKLYPNMRVTLSSLEEFNPEVIFDIAVSVMVFEHISEPEIAFKKISSMLNPGSQFFMVTGDKTHFITPRHNYNVQTQELENGEVAVETQRPNGTMYDIVRPIENYKKYAESAGFQMVQDIAMPPTEDMMENEPKYSQFKDKPLTHLLIFKKNE